MRILVVLAVLFALLDCVLCSGFSFFGYSGSDLTYDNDTQPSVINEKYPLLQVYMGGLGVAGLSNSKLRVTNLGNLGSTKYTSEFKKRKTVLFVYGFLDTAITIDASGGIGESPSAMMYVAYLYRSFGNTAENQFNTVAIEWSKYNKGDYLSVVQKLQPIANEIGDQLYNMAFNSSDPIDLSTWHIVGFSLGAHMAGLIARRVKERTNGKFMISRVTALDPAGPLLNYPIISLFFPHVEKSDAKFVDVIHTNADVYGSSWKIGHIDFWPNYGDNQPGCPKSTYTDLVFHALNACNHIRAVFLYVYSTKYDKKNFPAVRCTRNLFQQLQCTNDIAYMGFDASPDAPEGDYYLITDSTGTDDFASSNGNPFDLGEKGYLPFLNGMSTHGDGTNSFSD